MALYEFVKGTSTYGHTFSGPFALESGPQQAISICWAYVATYTIHQHTCILLIMFMHCVEY